MALINIPINLFTLKCHIPWLETLNFGNWTNYTLQKIPEVNHVYTAKFEVLDIGFDALLFHNKWGCISLP